MMLMKIFGKSQKQLKYLVTPNSTSKGNWIESETKLSSELEILTNDFSKELIEL